MYLTLVLPPRFDRNVVSGDDRFERSNDVFPQNRCSPESRNVFQDTGSWGKKTECANALCLSLHTDAVDLVWPSLINCGMLGI